jgi:hypothetical protein
MSLTPGIKAEEDGRFVATAWSVWLVTVMVIVELPSWLGVEAPQQIIVARSDEKRGDTTLKRDLKYVLPPGVFIGYDRRCIGGGCMKYRLCLLFLASSGIFW